VFGVSRNMLGEYRPTARRLIMKEDKLEENGEREPSWGGVMHSPHCTHEEIAHQGGSRGRS